MGCCLSTKKPPKKDDKCRGAPPPKPPPPPPVEEEMVKEVLVLSENPILKPSVPDVVEKKSDRYKSPENEELKIQSTAEIKPPKESTVVIKLAEDINSEVSEQSEICSFTQSFSTTTTAAATAMEKRDDSEEVNQKSPVRVRRKMGNSGDITGGRERIVRSPARLPVPSPEKRKPVISSRSVQGRAMSSERRNAGVGMGPPNGLRRDAGEGSARRSRSPVTRGQVGPRQNARYRSPGLSENGRSGGGRSPARALDNGVKVEKSSEGVVLPENTNVETRNDDVPDETGESLENPFVSLECFIFL